MADENHRPWYLRPKPPVFCNPCRTIYEAIAPTKRLAVILGAVLWAIGMIMIIAIILTCITTTCTGVAAGLTPVSLLLMWIGYALFHCGWAAHLLDEPEFGPKSGSHVNPESEEATPFHTAYDQSNTPPAHVGYWQFAEDEAWQTVATREQLH